MKKLLSLVLALIMVLSVASFASADEKNTLITYEVASNELTTWNIQYSQAAADLNVLVNCIDGLLTNDSHGNLKLNAAKSYETEDGGKTWTFTLQDGMTWVNKDGEVQADVVATDWATGLEWVLNYAKNDSYNVSMPAEMIAGANDYYEYTKKLTEEQGEEAAKALDIDWISTTKSSPRLASPWTTKLAPSSTPWWMRCPTSPLWLPTTACIPFPLN